MQVSEAQVRCLVGPTAVGKSRIALAVAELAGAEIVSLDSMQVYRGMDVGTAKPDAHERSRVRHHMLDLVEAHELYDVQRFLRDLEPVLAAARAQARRLFFVGGTGFYLKALTAGLFEGPPVDRELRARIEARAREHGNALLHLDLARFDPRAAQRIHINDTKRLVRAHEVFEQTGRTLSDWQREWSASDADPRDARTTRTRRLVGLDLDVRALDRRIAARTHAMLASGWPAEVQRIREQGGFSASAIQALGYVEVQDLVDGKLALDACAERISLRTRQFARRQRTWYRKFQDLVWFRALENDRAEDAREPELVHAILRAFDWSSD